MTLEEVMKRIEALEAKLEMVAPGPAVESHQIPDGWMLVHSDHIPWPDDNTWTWEMYDPSAAVPWVCTRVTRPIRPTLIVARPIRDA